MKRIAGLVILLTIFSKILGFSRELILAYYYGASHISDAYLISLTISGTIVAFIGVGLTTNFIPMYTKIMEIDGAQKAKSFMNNVVNFTLIVSTLIVILTIGFTEQIVKVFAVGFEGETLDLAVSYTRISIMGIYFYCLYYVFSGFLNMKKKFLLPVLTTLPFNITIILSILLSTVYGTKILALGFVLAVIFQVLFLVPSLIKEKYKYSFVLDYKSDNLRTMIYLSLPVILGTSVNQINVLIDRTIASSIVVGGISALNYSSRLNHFILGIFVMSIATVVFPTFSKLAVEKDFKGLKKSLKEVIIVIALIIIPATIGTMIFSKPIVEVLFGRGAFDLHAMSLTSSALFFYSIGLIGFGLREVLARVFYSLQDTKTPMINAAIGMVLNIILNITLSKYLGISGLALATSLAAITTAMLMFFSLRKRIGHFGMKSLLNTFIKISISAFIMGATAKFIFSYLTVISSQTIALFLSIVIGLIVYLIILYFMKIDEVGLIVKVVTAKLNLRRN
ncbi:murein biosynthesis integral membrane protein MurJ [Sutcliffiella horikoshii]|uniref:Probable lipid II flippase MurJ n=1 Tax=Sutcliffiella horikoshii TaxID=79883 RepID=A0A5D4T683_9BACI|nr:murein biosynthesis integral membrane protein MurJ [Sutcliffiella horikoshii]TYS69706.1 murein biosynthesis integral membrane protein MurJ [Sutcliffiella horikoshii]